jgi:hypothetical protein
MKGINQGATGFITITFLYLIIISCASIPKLNVNYRLPPQSDRLRGKSVCLVVRDARTSKVFVGRGAQKDFQNFPGTIALTIFRKNEKGLAAGLYDPHTLVREGFRRKLENDGLEVASKKYFDGIELLIELKEFVLDLVERKWIVTMGYEAKLLKGGDVLATQMISGQAERMKLLGRGEAETAIGEIFTDMINRLDVLDLFEQARL